METPRKAHWGAAAITGIGAGAVAGMMMAMVTMIANASVAPRRGFFTAMYILASPFLKSARQAYSLSTSMARAGHQFHFSTGPALLGAGIHMMNSMIIGMIFSLAATALLAYFLSAREWGRGEWFWGGIVAGMMFGGITLAAMEGAVVLLPHLFGAHFYLASRIGSEVGWSTWVVAHLVFGMVLGLLPAIWAKSLVANQGRARGFWHPATQGT